MRTFRSLALALSVSTAPLAQAAQLVIGQVAPLSGPDATQGRAYGAGMQLVFNAINKAGGVGGHAFTLVGKDDTGRPANTLALTRELLEQYKPLVLAGYFGSRNVADLVASGLLAKERIALVGLRTSEIRPETPQLYPVRAGLRDEIGKITEHLATIGISRLGLFYEDGPGAPALLAATEEAAAKARGKVVVKASYAPGTTAVGPAVEAFLKAAPQAILLVSSGATAAGFIEQYRVGGGAQLFAHSGADVEQMAKRLSEEQMQGVAIAQVTPNPYKMSTRLAKEMAEALAAQKPSVPVSYAMMEGYIAAKVIVEAVRRQGARPTREGTMAALDAMDSYDLGGYMVSYKPGQRVGSRFVELSIVSSSGRIRQ
jgi:ABC-type branched-subunit amino acid transport system substrate-binding protein